jgi:hypothetical protein
MRILVDGVAEDEELVDDETPRQLFSALCFGSNPLVPEVCTSTAKGLGRLFEADGPARGARKNDAGAEKRSPAKFLVPKKNPIKMVRSRFFLPLFPPALIKSHQLILRFSRSQSLKAKLRAAANTVMVTRMLMGDSGKRRLKKALSSSSEEGTQARAWVREKALRYALRTEELTPRMLKEIQELSVLEVEEDTDPAWIVAYRSNLHVAIRIMEETLRYRAVARGDGCACLPWPLRPCGGWLRKMAYMTIKYSLFDQLIMICIIVNCVFLALEDPAAAELPDYQRVVSWLIWQNPASFFHPCLQLTIVTSTVNRLKMYSSIFLRLK